MPAPTTSWPMLVRPRLFRRYRNAIAVFALLICILWLLITWFHCLNFNLTDGGRRHLSASTSISNHSIKSAAHDNDNDNHEIRTMNVFVEGHDAVESSDQSRLRRQRGSDYEDDDAAAEAMLSIMATVVDVTSPPSGSINSIRPTRRHTINPIDDPNKVLFLPRAPKYVPPSVLVHLDFKGAPPKLTYLQELLPLLSRLGATGLLIEYEDMFPYWGQLTHLSAYNAYTYEDVRRLLQFAKDSGLEVIPLVQTFGHMEFVLKSAQFKTLREVPSLPQAICPSKSNSTALIHEMIDQTMALHPDIRYLHIGCDEVFHLGRCRDCHRRLRNITDVTMANRNGVLFLEHVRDVARYVKRTYAGVQPIVWDDMFRAIPAEYIVRSRVHNGLVEPMIWAYSTDIQNYITPEILNKYADVFPKVWAAGAFKGAFGETHFLPDVYRHALNTAEWLSLMRKESYARFARFRGFVLTGWQRYDHFSVLCELLPASVPSLAVNLAAAINGRLEDAVLSNASVHLGCPENDYVIANAATLETLQDDRNFVRHMGPCAFPGSSAFRLMRNLQSLKSLVAKHLRKMTKEDGWLTLYNIRRNFSNPYRVRDAAQRTTLLLRSTTALKKTAETVLKSFFEKSTVDEWVEQQIEPLISALLLVESRAAPILARDTWPRRPFA